MIRPVLAALLILAVPVASHAKEKTACRLDRFSTIPITTLDDGRFTVPVVLNGRTLDFLVDTGGVSATIDQRQAFNMQLFSGFTNRELRGVGGTVLSRYATIENFSLGRLQGVNIPVYIDPRIPPGADGTLSPDMMKRYDVDIDMFRGTMSLFSQKHCPGNVVHWTRSGYVILPMRLAASGHIEVPLVLDGVKLTAMLDTGAQYSLLNMRAAKALGITETDPALKPVTEKDSRYKMYDYPFKILDFNGVAVSNPRVRVVSENFLPGRNTDMIIGVSILRRLHLYIAYGEERLYVTPATAN